MLLSINIMKKSELKGEIMKKFTKLLLKILKYTILFLVSLVVLLLIVRFIGRKINNKTPEGGINESMYIEVNGQEQWINIYGENKDNPVLLYLHGGPGNATSFVDWAVLRKLAKDYTIVNWDQRNCGKTQLHDPQDTPITAELMRKDIDYVIDYILEYMKRDKLTIMGMSWGTMYGGDYATRHPEKVEDLIFLSLALDCSIDSIILDYLEDRIDFRTAVDNYGYELFLFYLPFHITEDESLQKKYFEAKKQVLLDISDGDEEYYTLVEKIDTTTYVEFNNNPNDKKLEKKVNETYELEEKLLKKYGYYTEGGLFDDADINPYIAIFFNPYYSVSDLSEFEYDALDYNETIIKTLDAEFSLSDNMNYEMPVYILQGDMDCQCGLVQKYYEDINAPYKEIQIIQGGHVVTMTKTEELAKFVHKISMKDNNK